MRWPDRAEVDEAFRAWAEALRRSHPEILEVGYFGSYARGDWGPGSDLDIIIVLPRSTDPLFRRLLDVTDDGLPVPADILVYTKPELDAMRVGGRRFTRELDATAVWA